MSYILEALKKSEYARQHGRVADVVTRSPFDIQSLAPQQDCRLPALGIGILLLAVAVAGWWRPWQAPPAALVVAPLPAASATTSSPAAAPAAATTAAVNAPLASPTPPRAAIPAPAVAEPVSHPAPARTAPAAATVQLPSAQPLPVATTTIPTRAVLPERAPAPGAPQGQAKAPAGPAAGAALTAPPNRVLAFFELPPSVRERIPRLAVSGFSYTEQADLRLAVINDKVLHQGEDAAPGIILERINSDGVVLNFSGYRFRPQR